MPSKTVAPADLPDRTADDPLGAPGAFPFTRGIHPTMYRGRLLDDAAIRRIRDVPQSRTGGIGICSTRAGAGLSVAFDLPTQIGYDSDHALARGEVGRVGVAIDSIEDMTLLFDGSRSTVSRPR